jgi:hypothetical protein
LGYQSLPNGLVIEFDFGYEAANGDPTYPHISVQYRSDGLLSADHSYSLAFTSIPKGLIDAEVRHKLIHLEGSQRENHLQKRD